MSMVWIECVVFLLVENWIILHIFIVCFVLLMFIIVLFAALLFVISILEALVNRWIVLNGSESLLICCRLCCASFSYRNILNVLFHIRSIVFFNACCISFIIFCYERLVLVWFKVRFYRVTVRITMCGSENQGLVCWLIIFFSTPIIIDVIFYPFYLVHLLYLLGIFFVVQFSAINLLSIQMIVSLFIF